MDNYIVEVCKLKSDGALNMRLGYEHARRRYMGDDCETHEAWKKLAILDFTHVTCSAMYILGLFDCARIDHKYVALANLDNTTLEEIKLWYRTGNNYCGPMWLMRREVEDWAEFEGDYAILGKLTCSEEFAIQALCDHKTLTPREAFELYPDECSRSGWNNRLEGLCGQGIATSKRDGRHKRYKLLFDSPAILQP